MSSARTAGLIFIAICLAVSSTTAQQHRRGKPPAKSAGTEVPDQREKAAELFEAGQNAHQKGELEKAVGLYGEALEHDPSLWQAEFQRGAAYFSLNRLAEAKASMVETLRQLSEFADAPEAREPLARTHILQGEILLAGLAGLAGNDTIEAEKSFRRALELNPQAARARIGLAEIMLGGGKYAEAVVETKAAIEAGADSASVYMTLGEALTLSGKFDEALASLNEAVKREPKNAIAFRRRAEIYLARNDPKSAIDDLRACAEIEPDVQNRLRLAGALAAAKRYDEALPLYQRILQDEPANNEARTALAAVMIESGKGAEAVAQLESLVKVEPNRADLRAQLAELYLQAQPEKALEQYQAAAKIEPSQPAHPIGVAASLVKLGRFQEAASAARQALEQNPKEDVAIFARTNLATALFKLDDFQNALGEYIRIFDYQRKRGDRKRTTLTLYFLGICFDKLGVYEQALKAYEQFMALASAENQLEIDKVKLRLPSLRNQIKQGKGVRKK
jgi:tetratricopeptide (TPR) repeat protein